MPPARTACSHQAALLYSPMATTRQLYVRTYFTLYKSYVLKRDIHIFLHVMYVLMDQSWCIPDASLTQATHRQYSYYFSSTHAEYLPSHRRTSRPLYILKPYPATGTKCLSTSQNDLFTKRCTHSPQIYPPLPPPLSQPYPPLPPPSPRFFVSHPSTC